MSIGHSSSAYSLLVVKPSGSVSAAEHDDELPAPEVDGAQPVAEHPRLAQPLQRVVDADEDGVAGEGEDGGVGVQRPQPAVRQLRRCRRGTPGTTSFSATTRPTRKATMPHASGGDGEAADDRVVVGERVDGACRPDAGGPCSATELVMRRPFGSRMEADGRVVEQDAERRRGRVVELAGADGPDEGDEKAAGDGPPAAMSSTITLMAALRRGRASASTPALRPMMVSELTGISTAVASGVSRPGSASAEPERRCRRPRRRSRATMTCRALPA